MSAFLLLINVGLIIIGILCMQRAHYAFLMQSDCDVEKLLNETRARLNRMDEILNSLEKNIAEQSSRVDALVLRHGFK